MVSRVRGTYDFELGVHMVSGLGCSVHSFKGMEYLVLRVRDT